MAEARLLATIVLMSDNDSYQASVTQLKDWYKLASDNSGNQQFYVYLFNYVKTIDSDEHLKEAANLFWFSHLVYDHKDDKEMHALLEKIVVDAKSEPNSKKKVENTLSLLKIALSDDIKEVQLYYSWILLDVIFYGVYKLKADDLKEVDFDTIDYEKVLGIEVSFTQFEEMRSKLKQAYQASDSNSTPFSRATFVTALHVFHTKFINWLPENVDSLAESQPSEQGTKAELFFDNIVPKVKLENGDELAFSYMKTSTCKLMEHCYKNPGIAIKADKLPKEIDLEGKALIDSLRGSKFYPGEVLSVFLDFTRRPSSIMLHKVKRLDALQLQRLIDEAD